jgi:hypothetical protein
MGHSCLEPFLSTLSSSRPYMQLEEHGTRKVVFCVYCVRGYLALGLFISHTTHSQGTRICSGFGHACFDCLQSAPAISLTAQDCISPTFASGCNLDIWSYMGFAHHLEMYHIPAHYFSDIVGLVLNEVFVITDRPDEFLVSG